MTQFKRPNGVTDDTENYLRRGGREIAAYYLGHYDDMGVYPLEVYERNRAKAELDGFAPCTHCGRGMTEADPWVIMSTGFQTWVHVDSWFAPEYAENLKFLSPVGATCAKKLCGIEYRMRLSEVANRQGIDYYGAADWAAKRA